MIGEYCLIRTFSAGVHMGYLVSLNGTAGEIRDGQRLWSWTGAFSLHEISLHGVSEESNISEVVPRILLTEIIEVIPCTEEARKNLQRARNNPSGE